MPTIKRKVNFFDTEQGAEIETQLLHMTGDAMYSTTASYSPNTVLYPDNSMSFTQKHKSYMIAHPDIDPAAYMSNLRLKTKLRR